MHKRILKAMWLLAVGVALIALAVNISAQNWWWSGIMILTIALDLFMLRLSYKN